MVGPFSLLYMKLYQIFNLPLCINIMCRKKSRSVEKRLIGSFIRWYGRPVDLPRVIEILCLFTSGAQRNEWKDIKKIITSGRSGDVPYQHIKVPISSVNNICFLIHTTMYGFHWSIPHLHIRYYCALRYSTWLRNVGHRVYYFALR